MPEGQPEVVPADGLTTRQRRNRPLLMIHTGDGKGKSTAAFGLALRGWNQGWSVGVFQFVKSAKWRIGEQTALETLAEVHDDDRPRRADRVAQDGFGLVLVAQDRAAKMIMPRRPPRAGRRSSAGWPRRPTGCTCWTSSPTRSTGAGSTSTTWSRTLTERPGQQHVIITGRRADPKLIEVGRLVTEMTKIKHPFDDGQKGQRGHRMVRPAPGGDRRARLGPRQDDRRHRADGRAARARAWRWPASRSARTTSIPATTRWPPAGPAAISTRTCATRSRWRRCCCTVRRPRPGRRRRDRGGDGAVRRADRRRRVRLDRPRRRPDRRPGDLGAGHLPGLPDRRGDRARPAHLRPGRPAHRGDPEQGRLGPARRRDRRPRWRRPGSRCSACCPGTPGSRRRRGISVWCPPPSGRPPPRPSPGWPSRSAEHVDLTDGAGHRPRRPAPRPLRRGSPTHVVAPPVGGPAGGRDRGRPGVHLPLRRDRRTAAGRRLRAGRLRPAHRSGAAAGHGRALSGRRLSRGARRRTVGERRAARRHRAGPSPPACRPSPSAPGCCTCAEPWTARRWSARSTPRRR